MRTVDVWLSTNIIFDNRMMVALNLNTEPDSHSLLTKISAYESAASTPRSICLHCDDRFVGFEKNDDPNICKWMETKPEKSDWERYKHKCWQFGIPAIRAIRDCLNGESNLNLSHYIPKSIGTAYAFEVLSEQPLVHVTRIDMRDCPMTETGCLSINEFLRRCTPVEYLNLKNNRIGSKGIELLEHGLYVNQGIKYLSFSGCKIGDEGAKSLAKALNGNELCEHLDISYNNLYTGSGDAIGDILSTTHIQVLNLSWNELYTTDCVTKILKGVKQSAHIKEIDYSWNGLSGTEWMKSFKQALIKNVTLETLRLENNRLSGVADQMMSAIEKSLSLRKLYLGDNPWKEQDWKNIVNVYLKPSNLNVLGLGAHTYLTEECVALIRKAMNANPELKFIYKGQIKEQPTPEVNFKNILVDRLKALAMKPKKKKLRKNMGHFFLKLKAENIQYDYPDNFAKTIESFGAKLDGRLVEQFANEFSTDMIIDQKKVTKVPLIDSADYYLARHPTEPPKVKADKKKKKKNKEDKKNGGKKISDKTKGNKKERIKKKRDKKKKSK